MTNFRIGDIVVTTEKLDATILNYIEKGSVGAVIDKTVPNYYRVRFNGSDTLEWIDGKYLKKYKGE